jgi:hypothetical protein
LLEDVASGEDERVSNGKDRGVLARFGRAAVGRDVGGFVYGTIVVLSVVVAGAKAFPHGPGHVALLVAVTTVVFFLAHVYAHGLAHSIEHDIHLSLAQLLSIARREAAIVGAGVPPEAALILGALGLFSEQVATWLAMALGLVVLAVAGSVFARVERLRPLSALAVIISNLALGIVLVLLKVLVTH